MMSIKENGFTLPVEIIEKETHSGNYNAVHYIVELTVDRRTVIFFSPGPLSLSG